MISILCHQHDDTSWLIVCSGSETRPTMQSRVCLYWSVIVIISTLLWAFKRWGLYSTTMNSSMPGKRDSARDVTRRIDYLMSS
jgi:hypothetical protein